MARETLLDRLEKEAPKVSRAFAVAINKRLRTINLNTLTDALERGDIGAVFELLDLSAGHFSNLAIALTATYAAGGEFGHREIERQAVKAKFPIPVPEFNVQHPRARAWLEQQSSRLVREVTEGQRDAIRTAIAWHFDNNVSGRAAALDIVGRINKVTKRREGGIIGLTDAQSKWANNAKDELKGGPGDLRKYLQRERRDKRFDPIVKKAIKEKTPLSPAKVNQIAGRYKVRLLEFRGKMVARQETMSALQASKNEGLDQLIGSGMVQTQDVIRTWDAAADMDTRPHHAVMDGQRRIQGEPFISGIGGLLLYPTDTSLGATAADVINCRCLVHESINFINAAARRQGVIV